MQHIRNSSFGFGSIVVVALVLEDGFLAEYAEAVGKAVREEEHPMVVLGKLDGYVLPEGGRADTYIYRHIQHTTT